MSRRTDAYVGGVLGDRYEIVRKLGAGGMGEVFEARRVDLGDRVAVKILREEDREDPELRARFLREAQTLARVQSPHVVRIVDFMAPPGQVAFIAMEFLEGQSAGELLRLRGPFSMREVGPLAQQMFAGLAAVHAVGLVHRDIKPQNLVIVDGGPLGPLVKIVDFGLAKTTVAPAGERPLTHHAGMLGTPSYMAPEQIGGNATIDARADIYGAAATFIALATGKTVYDERGDGVLAQVISGQRLPVAAVAPELGAELCAVLERALAADRNLRHARIEDLASEIARGLGRAASSGPATYAALPSLSRDDLEPASRTALTEAPVFSTASPGAAEATRGRAGTGPMPARPAVPGLMGTLDGSRAYVPPAPGYGPPGGAPHLTAAGPYVPPMAPQGPHVPSPSRPSFPSQSGFNVGPSAGAPPGVQAPAPFTTTFGPASQSGAGGPLSSPHGPPSQSGYGYGPPSAPRPSVPSGAFLPQAAPTPGPAPGGPTYPPGSFPVSPGSGAPGPMAGPYGVPLPANGPPASSSRGKAGLLVGIVVGVLVLGGVAFAAFMLRRTERDVAAPKAVGAGAAVEAGVPGVATSVEPSAAEANVASAPAGSSAPRGQTVSRDGGAKPSPSAAPSGSGLAPVPVPSGGKSLGFDPTRTTRPCTTEAQCASDQFCDKDVGFCVCARGNPSNMAGLWCGDRCVAQTPKVCGACGTSCAATENCALPPGSWVGKCTDCTGRGASYAVCGNSCSNTDRDVANCGRCRHNCFTDAICKGKTCLCQQGQCVPH